MKGGTCIAGLQVQQCTPIQQIVSSGASDPKPGSESLNTAGSSTHVVGTIANYSDPFVRRLNNIRNSLQSFDQAARHRLRLLSDRLDSAEDKVRQLQEIPL